MVRGWFSCLMTLLTMLCSRWIERLHRASRWYSSCEILSTQCSRLWLKNGQPSFHEPICLITLTYRVTRCQPFKPHANIIAFFVLSPHLLFCTKLVTLQCLHTLIRDLMNIKPDIHIWVLSLSLHCDISTLSSSPSFVLTFHILTFDTHFLFFSVHHYLLDIILVST